MSLADRITDYLASGGLFNPEMANHEAVRDLLIDCRAVLASATPADVGEEPVAWRWRPQGGTVWVVWEAKPMPGGNLVEDAVVEIEPLYSATALERVVRDRDEARATLDEVCLSSRQEWQRATTAEAKLAEARKVIEWEPSDEDIEAAWAHGSVHCYQLRQFLAEIRNRAARRWIEETK